MGRGSAESNSSLHTRAPPEEGGSIEGGMERGLEAESTSFSRHKRGVHKSERERERRAWVGNSRTTRRGNEKLERARGYEISYVWLSVRPFEPGTHQQPPGEEEELGR